MKSIWDFRGFIISSVKTEYAVRFSRSRIGVLWMVIHPLAQVAVFALVLSKVIGSRSPAMDSPYNYAVYLMAGQLAWTGFSETILRSLTAFINQGGLLKKASFPLTALPVIDFLLGLINSVVFFAVIVLIFSILGRSPSWHVIHTPALILLNLYLAIAIGVVVGILNVFVRGVGQVVPIVLNFGFWLTPIVYVSEILPQWIRSILVWNPMYHVVHAFQDVLVFHRTPEWTNLLIVACLATVVLMLAITMLRRAGPEMADVL